MARTKKQTAVKSQLLKTKKSSKKEKNQDEISVSEIDRSSQSVLRPSKKLIIALIIIGIGALLWYNKKWVVAATVDGKPITNLALQQELNKTYREQALNKLVNAKIFDQFEKEATGKGIIVSDEELNSEIAKIEEQYGGKETFDSLLSQQGISRDDFTKQVKVNVLAEKFFENEIKPTDEEINKFINDENNQLTPEATDAAKFKTLAEEQIKQDKLTTKLREKFQEIKSKVVTF